MNTIYNSYFFQEFYAEQGGGNYMEEETWRPFFGSVADKIIEIWNPQKVLDAGCARGYLVEALRARGVEAYGIDISEYAINNASEDIKEYCNIQSVIDPLPASFPDRFDVITCIEVLEHLYTEDAEKAVANLCNYSDFIIFSSTPDDIKDQTHVNVQLPEYWTRLYAQNSFYRNVFQEMGWLCPWAAVYEKRADIKNIVNEYERKLRIAEVKKTDEIEIALKNTQKEEYNEILNRLDELNYIVKSKEISNEEEYDEILQRLSYVKESGGALAKILDELKEEIRSKNENEAHAIWKKSIDTLRAELEYYKEKEGFENYQKQRAKDAYDLVSNATLWKATKALRAFRDYIKNGFKATEPFEFELESFGIDKEHFISQNKCYVEERAHLWTKPDLNGIGTAILKEQQEEISRGNMELQVAKFEQMPLISVIVPLYNPPMEWLPRVIETLQAQVYPHWELCVADDGSPKAEGREYMSAMSKLEPRIKFITLEKNGGISAASNEVLKIAKGEFIALVDQDDEITPDAFFWMVKRLNEKPQLDFIYSDECKLDSEADIKYFDFYFKPDWSPRLLMNHMYTGHLTMYRTDLVREVGGFRSKFDFSQDYDLALRISDITTNIEHVERVLYFWRAISTSAATGAKDFARVGNMHALKDWYNRHNLDVVMQMMPRGNYGRIVREKWPLVSVIIPTDNVENLSDSLHGLMEVTNYSNLEFIPVTNSKVADEIETEFSYLEGKLQICRYDKPYNFSDKCNEGAQSARGDVCLFYNDDIVPVQKDWLERLVELLELPWVGSSSPMLTKPDQTLQYAGMITGTPGLVGTAFNGYPADDYIYGSYDHMLLRDVTVLSGACFAMKKVVFEAVGGFDAKNTPNGHSDVDLSFKLLDRGYYNVYTPYSRLVHIGNHSWHETTKKDKADIYCLKQWGKYLSRDGLFTDSQKRMFYVDFPYKFKIYSPKEIANANSIKKDILFVTHELSRTGAPIVLMEAVKCAILRGDFPVVLSYQDGILREEYTKMGVTVIIDESALNKHRIFERFARNFDIVLVNTIVCHEAVVLLGGSLPNVYWWLHDGQYAIDHCQHQDKLPRQIEKNIKALYVSEYVKNVIQAKGFDYPGQIWHLGLELAMNTQRIYNKKKLRFLFIGTFEERKGPDILMKAIKQLPEDILVACEFLMVGLPMNLEVYNELREFSKKYTNVAVRENIPRNEVLKLYETSAAVIIPSRDEPLPTVAIESMNAACPVICSDHCGIADFIKNKQNGLIFNSGNISQLVDAIIFAVKHIDEMDAMGIAGKKIYQENFTMDYFKKTFDMIVK